MTDNLSGGHPVVFKVQINLQLFNMAQLCDIYYLSTLTISVSNKYYIVVFDGTLISLFYLCTLNTTG